MNSWDSTDLDTIRSLLGQHQFLRDALRTISDVFNRPVTRHMLDGAFRRRGLPSASKHLAQPGLADAGIDINTDLLENESQHKDPKQYTWITGAIKVLVLPDAHIPFHNHDLIMEALDRDGDADMVIFGGDTLDCFQVGPHGSRKLSTTLEQDTETAIDIAEAIARTTKVLWIDGNHERWIFNHQAKRTKAAIKFLQDESNIGDYISWRINARMGRVNQLGKVVNPVVEYVQPPNNWLCRINNVIVSHPNNFFKSPACKTAMQTFYYHNGRDPSIEGVFIGHTHRLGKINYQRKGSHVSCNIQADRVTNWPRLDTLDTPDSLFVCEVGCLCHEMDYSIMGNINYKDPPSPGYGVIYFHKDGSLDRTRSGFRVPR